MKRYAFLYHDTAEHTVYREWSYQDQLHIEERSYPKGTQDWEVLEAAREEEVPRELRNKHVAGEQFFTRKLIRIVEIARDLALPPAE